MEPNKISVVIVSFNRVADLRQSLQALHGENTELQVIVVDNGSRDGAANLSDDFPAARFSKLPRNFGLTRALNIGIRAAEGDYVLLLHDDVLIDQAAVVALAEFLEARPDIAAVCPNFSAPQIRPLPTPANPDPLFVATPPEAEAVAECVACASIMLRTPFLRSMGFIDERYGNYGSSIEICAQIKSSGRKLVVLDSIPAVHGSAPSPMPAGTLKSDRVSGTAAFLSKHHGFATGLAYRMKTLSLTGTKIDGSG